MPDYLTAAEAADFLGVKRPTLYAYVSRGLLDSAAAPEDDGDGRQKRYREADLERLKRRSDASSGRQAAAAEALDWGPPSLQTKVGEVTPMGPKYRGRRLRELVEENYSFEEVAALLWDADATANWPSPDEFEPSAPNHDDLPPVDALIAAVHDARLDDPRRHLRERAAEIDTARRLLVGSIADSHALLRGEAPDEASSVATLAAAAIGAPDTPDARRLVETTLIVCADHGLNASTFAGRVASSTGADLYACVLGALSAFSGPLHGLHSERVMALMEAVDEPADAEDVLKGRLRRGESVPGFGHPLYEHGDPRFRMLYERSRQVASPGNEQLEVIGAVCEAADEVGLSAPNLDVGLSAVVAALDLAPGAGPFLFACGRMAGWIAHALEQRRRDHLLRPRSEYVEG